MTTPLNYALLISWVVGVILIAIAVLESFGTKQFRPWVYGFGLKVSDKRNRAFDMISLESLSSTDNVDVKIVSKREVLFHAPISLDTTPGARTVLPVKGRIIASGGGIRIVGLLPLFLYLAMAMWGVCWTLLFMRGDYSQQPSMRWIPMAMGLGVALVGAGVIAGIEIRRFRKAVSDLVEQTGTRG